MAFVNTVLFTSSSVSMVSVISLWYHAAQYLLAMPPLFTIQPVWMEDVQCVWEISRERSIFLSLLQKSLLREKKKLHLERINTSSDCSKTDKHV